FVFFFKEEAALRVWPVIGFQPCPLPISRSRPREDRDGRIRAALSCARADGAAQLRGRFPRAERGALGGFAAPGPGPGGRRQDPREPKSVGEGKGGRIGLLGGSSKDQNST